MDATAHQQAAPAPATSPNRSRGRRARRSPRHGPGDPADHQHPVLTELLADLRERVAAPGSKRDPLGLRQRQHPHLPRLTPAAPRATDAAARRRDQARTEWPKQPGGADLAWGRGYGISPPGRLPAVGRREQPLAGGAAGGTGEVAPWRWGC